MDLAPPIVRSLAALLVVTASAAPRMAQAFGEGEAAPLTSIEGPAGQADFLPMTNPADGTIFFPYTPPEVLEPHPAQVMTVFLPSVVPIGPDDRFPTIIHSPASVFGQGTAGSSADGLLCRALSSGYVVVSMGSVGAVSCPNAAPTTHRPLCTSNSICPLGGGGNPPGCWDPNLWYEPGTGPWNDFGYFYGEKDFTWVVQHLRWDSTHPAGSNMFHVDDTRILGTGTSTGAHYAAFAAFGPNRAWGPVFSAQAQQDTRIAALVMFEPIVWSYTLPPTMAGMPSAGAHWARSLDPKQVDFRVRVATGANGQGIVESPDRFLVTDSTSRQVRVNQPLVPCFIATGDNDFLNTGFGRNGTVNPGDYDRLTPPTTPPFVEGDPSVRFPTQPSLFRFHDAHNGITLKQDLVEFVDSVFHERHSRLFMQRGLNFQFWPPALTISGNAPEQGEVPDVNDLLFLDGLFNVEGGFSIDNTDVGGEILNWAGRELCVNSPPSAFVTCRNAGNNVGVLRGEEVSIGGSSTMVVRLCECPDGYDAAWVFGFDAPVEAPLPSGDVLLCTDKGSGELLGFSAQNKFPNGLVVFTMNTPNDPALIGTTLYTQAWAYDYDKVYDDFLTNAQDYEIRP